MIALKVNKEAKTVAVYEGMRTSVSNLLAEYEDAEVVNDGEGRVAIIHATEDEDFVPEPNFLDVFVNVPTRIVYVGQEEPTEKKEFYLHWSSGGYSTEVAYNKEQLIEELICMSKGLNFMREEGKEKLWILDREKRQWKEMGKE